MIKRDRLLRSDDTPSFAIQPVHVPQPYWVFKMPFDFQPRLQGGLLELRPLREEDFGDLCAVAADPLIWEQHPNKDHRGEAMLFP